MGNREIEDSLERLDKLTQEEARMATAEQLKMTHSVDGKVMGVDDRVRGVDDKLDQANRSLSFQSLIVIPRAQTASQGTSSEIVSCDGFRPQTHPSIITSHAKPITTAQLNGFSTEVYLISGNPLAPFCGYTENVCYS
jgi:hypothetical protein